MTAFWLSFGLIFAAEMGDKTQLVALAFATRYKARIVLAAILVATLFVHLFSVFLGAAAGHLLPQFWLNICAAVSFLCFAVWTLKGDKDDDQDKDKKAKWGPFLTVAVSFFIAELGDKTMLATVTIAAEQTDFVNVWLGSSLGMVAADGLAILAGKYLGHNLPDKPIRYGAAALFMVSGIWSFLQAFGVKWG